MVLSKIFEQLEFLLSEAEHSCNIVLKTYHRNCLRAHTVRPYGVNERAHTVRPYEVIGRARKLAPTEKNSPLRNTQR